MCMSAPTSPASTCGGQPKSRRGLRQRAQRGASEKSGVLSAMTALCFLGDEEFLGGDTVRAVAHPAPQRQLKRSQAAQLAFRSLDRGLDELLGNGAPIRKHDVAIPSLLFRGIMVSKKIGQFRTLPVSGWCVNIFLLVISPIDGQIAPMRPELIQHVSAIASPTQLSIRKQNAFRPHRSVPRNILEHSTQHALDHHHIVGRDPDARRRFKPMRERNDAFDETSALRGQFNHDLAI